MDKLYSIKEVAEKLSLAEITIRQWIRTGKLKGVKVGGARRISEEELKKFIK